MSFIWERLIGGRSELPLIATTVGIFLAAITLLSALGLTRAQARFQQEQEEKGELLARTLTNAFANAMYFHDVERLRHLAEVLDSQPEVTEYQIFNAQGRLLVASGSPQQNPGQVEPALLSIITTSTSPVARRGVQNVDVVSPIIVGSQPLGGLRLQLSDADWPLRRHRLLLRYSWQGTLALFLGLGLSLALRRAIRATAEMRENEERLRMLAEGMREVLWLQELDSGELLYLSPAYSEVFGEPPTAAIADPMSRYAKVHLEDRGQLEEAITADPPVAYELEYRLVEPDDGIRWIRERTFVVEDDSGRPWRRVGAADDVTKQKELESNLLHAQKMDSLGRMAGGIAHDFNNLLTGILGFATLGELRKPERDVAQHHFQQIRLAAERGGSLTQQLLSFARRQVVNPRVVNLGALILGLEELVQRVVGEEIETDFRISPDIWNVRIDPGQFEQVLLNLVANAREAMPSGGTLSVEVSNAGIGGDHPLARLGMEPGDYVLMAVADTGTGMTSEVAARVFEPFYSTKASGEGAGLGLAICYGIIKQGGGEIQVVSKEGHGTRVDVVLPRVKEAEEESTVESRLSTRATEAANVLVAEDDDAVRTVVLEALESQGHRVLEAGDGHEALALARSFEGRIDLLVTDVVMPKMRGPALADELRALHPGLRVLLVSGYSDDTVDREEATGRGVDFLTKPFSPAQLISRIRRLLQAGESRPGDDRQGGTAT